MAKLSRTHTLAAFAGSNFVGPRFLGPSSSSSSSSTASRSSSSACVPPGNASSSGSSLLRSILTSSIGVKLKRSSVMLSVTTCCLFPWTPLITRASSSRTASRLSEMRRFPLPLKRSSRTKSDGARQRMKCFAPSNRIQSNASCVKLRSPAKSIS